MPEHYGLSLENPNGCTPCDCDIGGSYDNNCEVTSGQCKCRPKLGGRRCDEVEDGYYTGSLDHLLFEGELALGSINPVSIFSFIFRIICQHLQFLPLVFYSQLLPLKEFPVKIPRATLGQDSVLWKYEKAQL